MVKNRQLYLNISNEYFQNCCVSPRLWFLHSLNNYQHTLFNQGFYSYCAVIAILAFPAMSLFIGVTSIICQGHLIQQFVQPSAINCNGCEISDMQTQDISYNDIYNRIYVLIYVLILNHYNGYISRLPTMSPPRLRNHNVVAKQFNPNRRFCDMIFSCFLNNDDFQGTKRWINIP